MTVLGEGGGGETGSGRARAGSSDELSDTGRDRAVFLRSNSF